MTIVVVGDVVTDIHAVHSGPIAVAHAALPLLE